MKKNTFQFISNLLVTLSAATLFFGMITSVYPAIGYATTLEQNYYILTGTWTYFLFLPFTIGSILFGIILKKQKYNVNKNIAFGVIFSILLVWFGSIRFIGGHNYSADTQYLVDVGAEINFIFPTEVKLIKLDLTSETQAATDDFTYQSETIIYFKNEDEVTAFKYRLFRNHNWTYGINYFVKNFIPEGFYLETKDDNYFMLYNVENQTYNTVTDDIGYHYIYLASDFDTNRLIIYQFEKQN